MYLLVRTTKGHMSINSTSPLRRTSINKYYKSYINEGTKISNVYVNLNLLRKNKKINFTKSLLALCILIFNTVHQSEETLISRSLTNRFKTSQQGIWKLLLRKKLLLKKQVHSMGIRVEDTINMVLNCLYYSVYKNINNF